MSELESKIEDVCRAIPDDMMINICMENGAAFVTLGCDHVGYIELPDSSDKSLVEQLDDALCVALNTTTPKEG
jgi:hypothetical protein